MSAMSAISADVDALVARLLAAALQILAHRLADQSGFILAPKPDSVGFAAVQAAGVRLKAKAGQHRALANGFRKKVMNGVAGVSVQDAQNADRFADDMETVLAGLAEAQNESLRWMSRIADIRDGSGLGVVPMLSELPAAIAKRIAEAEAEAGGRDTGEQVSWEQAPTGVELWGVYGPDCFPTVFACRLRDYGCALPPRVIWGFSVHEGEPGFRTLGVGREWAEEHRLRLFTTRGAAFAHIARYFVSKTEDGHDTATTAQGVRP